MSVRASVADYMELYYERIECPEAWQLKNALDWAAFEVNEEAAKVLLKYAFWSCYSIHQLHLWSDRIVDVKKSMSEHHDQNYETRMKKVLPLLNEYQGKIQALLIQKTHSLIYVWKVRPFSSDDSDYKIGNHSIL